MSSEYIFQPAVSLLVVWVEVGVGTIVGVGDCFGLLIKFGFFKKITAQAPTKTTTARIAREIKPREVFTLSS